MKAVELTTGAIGTSVAVTDANIHADWLIINGIGVLSYAELFKVIGATWVMILILKNIGNLVIWIYNKLKVKSH